ncbi:hypothetical protein [Moorena sp. SIO1F2]|uniref:hypothetical protein n=1 Tax=Moorena sp. SIO1F2 TaxID=2607819 RepID=UPI0025FA45BD|nr:hypothetical protein [Moorena sp. SIO1F2]
MPNVNMGDELLKNLIWVGPSKKELLGFPEDVIDEVGYILYRVQKNKNHPHIKPLKGLNGVLEIVTDYKIPIWGLALAVLGLSMNSGGDNKAKN